jgi:hypothetical protein
MSSLCKLVEECDAVLKWLDGVQQQRQPWVVVGALGSEKKGASYLVKKCLLCLVESAVSLPVPDVPPVTTENVRALKDVTTAITLVKQLRSWAAGLLAASNPAEKADASQSATQIEETGKSDAPTPAGKSKKRGPKKPRHDEKKDAEIAAAWKSSGLPYHRDLDKARGWPEGTTHAAVDRHRKRGQ